MRGTKIILFGIATSLCGISFIGMNFIAMCGGILGLLVAFIGLFISDKK